ncbi:Aspartic peptidase domain [Lasallia pustulata]|uniref:Aspartic peptidase domain n=1 Tax=Lasallia pustulata TaxID=136370 RepID=A0A1W5DD12_9LECA|nr:Aspartic peptidase domain [Lasallia pustulata]
MCASTCSLLVGALWATTILAAPTPEGNASFKPRSFTIPVIHERSLPAGLAERADGAVATYDLESVYAFKSPVLVGGQQLMLQIDTGSADLWVFSTELPSNETGSHTLYDPEKSSNFHQLDGYTFDINYVGGVGASGTVGTDTVDIGGAIVPNQAIELADTVGMQPQKQATFMENLQQYVDKPIFTTCFKYNDVGRMDFGDIQPSLYKGELTEVPVNNGSAAWLLDHLWFEVNGKPLGITTPTSLTVDTGGVLFSPPSPVADAYWANVNGAREISGQWVYPCGANLPDFGVNFGHILGRVNHTAVVPGHLLGQNVESSDSPGNCVGALQGITPGNGVPPVIGPPFMMAQFLVFNQATPSISFAPQA